METNIRDSEKQELLQTVEMFEAVTQADPDDYQSLDILKEAYVKLGRDEDILRISKQIARAHQKVGQVAQAILQYEGLLQKYPNDKEASDALKELEAKAKSNAGTDDSKGQATIRKPASELGKKANTSRLPLSDVQSSRTHHDSEEPDADEVLCELIVKHGLLKEKDVMEVLHGLQGQNAQLTSESIRFSLIQAFSDRGLLSPDQLIAFITERSNLAHMPLTIYDVQPDVVRLLPRDISFRHCTMPFDKISSTLMMATTNPFDERAKKAVQKLLEYNLQWYDCPPDEITQILKDVYLIGKASTKDD